MSDRPKLRERLIRETFIAMAMGDRPPAAIVNSFMVIEAVDSTMLAHPEWPEDE